MKLNKLLKSILPLDGSKTILGGWLVAVSVLGHFFPGVNLALLAQYIADNPSKTGLAAMIVGLIHKELKRRAPDAPE